MKDDHAKLSGSYCAITTGLSVCEKSVTSFLWSGKTYSGRVLGGVSDERYHLRKKLDHLEMISAE